MNNQVRVEVSTIKHYVYEVLDNNEVWDLINDEHVQSLYLENINTGLDEYHYVDQETKITNVIEEEE